MEIFRNTVVALALLLFTSLANANPVNINTASASVLADSIVGVGPDKAAAIVDYRAQNGPFISIDDLSKVRGIGSKTVDANKDNLTVE
jgi:competence protein ComEA